MEEGQASLFNVMLAGTGRHLMAMFVEKWAKGGGIGWRRQLPSTHVESSRSQCPNMQLKLLAFTKESFQHEKESRIVTNARPFLLSKLWLELQQALNSIRPSLTEPMSSAYSWELEKLMDAS